MVKLGVSDLAINKKAFHDYQILESFEAGIELAGTEVKSCRAKNIQIADAFCLFTKSNEIIMKNVTIAHYSHGNQFNHITTRDRRLLLHKREIIKLKIQVEAKGMSLIPLRFYLKDGKVKIQLGLCRGKNVADKRDALKTKAENLDLRRAMKGQ